MVITGTHLVLANSLATKNDVDDVIEGDFEERPDAKFYIKQNKGITKMTAKLIRSVWLF